MRRTLARLVVTCSLLVVLGPTWVWAGLQADVQRAIDTADLKGGRVAVSIRDAQTDAALVAIAADDLMVPASNMKLLTTGAALHALGPNFEFRTQLLRDGNRLIVLGDGDPGFGDPELLNLMQVGDKTGIDEEAFLDLWVQPISSLGLARIQEIVIDDRIFDREFIHPDWPADQLNRRYCAQTSGLTFHLNVLHFFPQLRNGGSPNVAIVRPGASWLPLTNRATCRTGPRDGNDMWIARQPGGNQLTFYGNCKFSYEVPVPVTIHNMPDFFGRLLANRLTRGGIAVDSTRVAALEDPAAKGQPVGPVIVTPISTAVTRCNRDSQNLYAESLLKRMGAARTGQAGSWVNGAAMVRLVLHERLHHATLASQIVVADGSGLSRKNRVAASTMTAWLNSFRRDPELGPIFHDSLGEPGVQGTLDNRFNGVDLGQATVRAKSGYINEVSCLSGYVTMSDGRQRSFSILVNDLSQPGTVSRAKKMQERIVQAIATDLAAVAVQLGSD